MLALGSLGFAELMLTEHRAAQTASRQSQARAFAESGAEVARQFLDRYPDDIQTAGGLYDNAQRFSCQLVADDDSPHERGRFTIVAPKIDDTGVTGRALRPARRIGEDQSGHDSELRSIQRIGSSDGDDSSADNTNSHTILMGLPGMTDDTADAILDWIDADDTPRDQGVESDFYGSLDNGYTPRDRPPVTIEELLLVKGVTPELLFGYDAVKMGYSSSDAVTGAISGVATDGSMDHGWAAYLTLWSAESTLSSAGTPKINLNQPNLQTLYNQLSSVIEPSWAEYIVAYRQGGGTADGGGHLDTTKLGQGRQHHQQPVGPDRRPGVARAAGWHVRWQRRGRTGKQGHYATKSVHHRHRGDGPVPAPTVRQLHHGFGYGDPGPDQHQPGPADRATVHPWHDLGFGRPDYFQSSARSGLGFSQARSDLSRVAPNRGDYAAGHDEGDASLYHGRGERLPGPNNRTFRQGKSRRPAGSHS